MPISFPSSPSVNQTYTYEGRVYRWTGAAWEFQTASSPNVLAWTSVPSLPTSSGTAGQIAYDGSYLYAATATNTWKRVAWGAWDVPTSITGLQLWLDASDASTLYDATSGGSLVAADGGVARWEDKSGNGRHATQSTSGSRPLRKTAIQGGKDVLRFDGTNDYIDSTDFLDLTSTQSITIIAVVRRAATGATHAIVSKYGKSDAAVSGTADGWCFRLRSDDKIDFFGGTDEGSGNSTRLSDATVSASTFCVLSTKATAGTLSAATIYRNGSVIASSATQTGAETLEDTTYAVTVGALRYTFNAEVNPYLQFFDGDIAEVIIYGTALSDIDRAAVESYLMAKWGIA